MSDPSSSRWRPLRTWGLRLAFSVTLVLSLVLGWFLLQADG
jgi:hypothetical protein